MLFELHPKNYPNITKTNVVPEEYKGIILPDHNVNVTIADCCTLIHQTIEKQDYSLWVNHFFIQDPVKLYIVPKEKIYSLYYSMENTLELTIANKVRNIKPGEVRLLEIPVGQHYGVFKKGIYRSLHITVNEANKFILKDQDYAVTLLREHYANMVL